MQKFDLPAASEVAMASLRVSCLNCAVAVSEAKQKNADTIFFKIMNKLLNKSSLVYKGDEDLNHKDTKKQSATKDFSS